MVYNVTLTGLKIKLIPIKKPNRELQEMIQILIEQVCRIKSNVKKLVTKVMTTKFLVANALRTTWEFVNLALEKYVNLNTSCGSHRVISFLLNQLILRQGIREFKYILCEICHLLSNENNCMVTTRKTKKKSTC